MEWKKLLKKRYVCLEAKHIIFNLENQIWNERNLNQDIVIWKQNILYQILKIKYGMEETFPIFGKLLVYHHLLSQKKIFFTVRL